MERGLAIVCTVVLASSALASPAMQSPASSASTADKKVAQAPGKRAANGQKPAPKAKPEKSALELAQDLLAKIDELAGAEDPGSTEVERRKLLDEADGRCDKADAAAETKEERAKTLQVRVSLAARAFDLEDWAVGVALYTDIVKYVGDPAGEWGPEHWYTLKMRGALYKCLAGSQRFKPFAEREYKAVIQMQRELAAAWDAKLAAALAAPGDGPLMELAGAADAHDALGITLTDARQFQEGLREVVRAATMLCDHAERLGDAELLRSICGDVVVGPEFDRDERLALTRRVLDVMEKRFPDRLDLILDLRVDLADFRPQDSQRDLVAVRGFLEELRAVDEAHVEPRLHALYSIGFALLNTGLPAESEPILRRTLDRARRAGLPATSADRRYAVAGLGASLVQLGRYSDAIQVYDAESDVPLSRLWKGRAQEQAGWLDDALKSFREALRTAEAGSLSSLDWGVRDIGISEAYAARREIGSANLMAGRTSLALATLEALCADVRKVPSPIGGDSELAAALAALADARLVAGDLQLAYPLHEEAYELARRSMNPDELGFQWYRGALGGCAFFLQRHAQAKELAQAAREACLRLGRPDQAIGPTLALAEALAGLEKWGDAQKFAEEALSGARSAPFKDPMVTGNAQAVLGVIATGKGEPTRGVNQLREGIQAMESAAPWPTRHASLAYYRSALLVALAALNDAKALHEETSAIASEANERIRKLGAFSTRERCEIAAGMLRQVEQVAALQAARPAAIGTEALFEWFASVRAASGPLSLDPAGAEGAGIQELRDVHLRARQHFAALCLRSDATPGPETAWLFGQAATECDAAERALLEKLPADCRFDWITTKFLSVYLRKLAALGVSIHRIRAAPPLQKEDRYLAFVLDGGENLRPVDLGPASAIEEKIRDWRQAVTQDRGRPVSKGESDPRALGESLRAAVLDPVLKGATEKRVFLCLDDALNTIPWDALPSAPLAKEAEPSVAKNDPSGKQGTPSDGKGGAADPKPGSPGGTNAGPEAKAAPAGARGPASPAEENRLVGDDYRIAELTSFRDLIVATKLGPRQPALLAIGDIDYSAPGEAARQAVIADRPMRSSSEKFGYYRALTWSAQEVDSIAKSFEDAQKKKAVKLTGDKATKKALFEQSPKATYLHISTHGYFAPEDLPALRGTGQNPMLEEVTGFAPLSLCGLALAGANSDVGALEEVTGIVTAEELAGLDLSACQLAVLSGCKTDIGVRRAGQDLASLKSALHAAGARNVIASLWRVPDLETSDLMSRFYEILWKEKDIQPDEALWKAKKSFRGQPLEVWAGWVFSGVPEGK